jgi:hypothetical protein
VSGKKTKKRKKRKGPHLNALYERSCRYYITILEIQRMIVFWGQIKSLAPFRRLYHTC